MSDTEIYYPKVRKADVVVAFSSDALPGAKSKMMTTLSFLLMKASKIRAWKSRFQSGLCAL